jgi:phage shock protein A
MGFFNNLFGRASRVARGQANKGMDAVEDATFESTLKQTVRDMKTELNRVVRASAEAMSNHNRLEAEYQRYARQSVEWKDRAKKALEAGNEDLAKKALAKKAECDRQVTSMQGSVDQARTTSDRLKTQVAELKQKIQEAERNASTLIARKNAAKAQKRVAEAMAGAGEADNAFAAIKTFEESVSREEASAKAYESLSVDHDKDLEEEFAKLDTGGVDADLEALKKEMNEGK